MGAYLPGAPDFTPVLVRFVLLDLFVLFLLTIVLPVLLRFTASDYPFSIFQNNKHRHDLNQKDKQIEQNKPH
jgi:hypothetical protein